MGAGGVEAADRHRLAPQQAVLRVEIQRDQVLLAGGLEIPHELERLGRAGDTRLVTRRSGEATSELEARENLAGARPADPGVGGELLEPRRRQSRRAVARQQVLR